MQVHSNINIHPSRQKNLLLIFLSAFLLQSCVLFSQVQSYPIKTINGVEGIVYKVKPAEGFFRIGKNFDTTEAIIREFNPHVTDGLKAGMEIFIPIKKEIPAEKNYKEHVVERKQTIFRIRRMYDITEDELIEMNPHLKSRSIQTGEVLKIPLPKKELEKEVLKDEVKTENGENGKPVKPETAEHQKQDKKPVKETVKQHKPETLNIAFLLPFMLDQKKEASDSRFVEFYSGALLAIKHAKESGINFNIHTYDVERSDIKIMEILQDSAFAKTDLIVGPAFSNQVSVIGDFARMNKIKTLIPFSSRIFDIETNPYIYQFNPGQDAELQKIQEILQSESNQTNIIFAELQHVSINDDGNNLTRSLKQYLNSQQIPYQTLLLNPDSVYQFRQALNPLSDNIIFFNTNRINSISLYLRELNQLSSSVNLKIYEPYSWRNSRIEKPRSFYLSVFKNEYPELSYEKYFADFSALFEWTPSNELPRYDLLGYDLLAYFINYVLPTMNRPEVSYPQYEGIQSNLKFEKASPTGGYINRTLNHYE
jgi:LysM repeat protein